MLLEIVYFTDTKILMKKDRVMICNNNIWISVVSLSIITIIGNLCEYCNIVGWSPVFCPNKYLDNSRHSPYHSQCQHVNSLASSRISPNNLIPHTTGYSPRILKICWPWPPWPRLQRWECNIDPWSQGNHVFSNWYGEETDICYLNIGYLCRYNVKNRS